MFKKKFFREIDLGTYLISRVFLAWIFKKFLARRAEPDTEMSLLVRVNAAWRPSSHPNAKPKDVMPICFILPSSITL